MEWKLNSAYLTQLKDGDVSKLADEEFEKVVDDKLEEIEAFEMNEEVWGVVQCNTCDFWGRMTGYIEYNNKRWIKFVCPECKSVEPVRNPEFVS